MNCTCGVRLFFFFFFIYIYINLPGHGASHIRSISNAQGRFETPGARGPIDRDSRRSGSLASVLFVGGRVLLASSSVPRPEASQDPDRVLCESSGPGKKLESIVELGLGRREPGSCRPTAAQPVGFGRFATYRRLIADTDCAPTKTLYSLRCLPRSGPSLETDAPGTALRTAPATLVSGTQGPAFRLAELQVAGRHARFNHLHTACCVRHRLCCEVFVSQDGQCFAYELMAECTQPPEQSNLSCPVLL